MTTHPLTLKHMYTDQTYAQREVSFVPDVEVEQQMCVKLLQQSLVLLICHLLYQQLRSNQHTDIHVTCWQLKQNIHTISYNYMHIYWSTQKTVNHRKREIIEKCM